MDDRHLKLHLKNIPGKKIKILEGGPEAGV
jgi:hypothetical protein